MNKRILASSLAALTIAASQAATAARDHISIVGSSTVYPFTTTVAERFSRATQFKTPVVESTGTGGGMKLFCQGVGESTADITGASRRIKQSELDMCKENGVDVVEVQVGYDGIVLANAKSAETFDLTRKDIFLALAKEVPNPDGSETLVENPYKTWKDVNPALPNVKIEVLGPPPTSGTRDAFAELAMEGGCKKFDWIAAKKKEDKNAYKAICHTVREDGAYVEAGENDNLIVNKLVANPNALGIFGFSFLDQNADKVHGSTIEGEQPTFDSIAEQSYPVSRPLFIYVKKAHANVIPGMKQFLAEITSERAWGEDGYLADKGMIPLPTSKRQQVAKNVRQLNALSNLAKK
ncbi:phosphate ABC transporter substrate-binding protein [Microbulbifer flavimaris]|uniref:Phosphate ABC transporter substrate-binding protein n=1 Tax=Microbulbifer flavimaris TaxID=1781068 RepID=A0ABX4I2L5_9GAMM|nr:MULTISPECIES: PstS family phosphate ABC transporter substrate-binding protein [Microbulbifer]KUJ83967.1 phosphate ABC transporter substrate-binding protein [Microbulbifer sp. ZGT114]PCO06145.1 phosphate ABC transporter substrate-binding protein [Microbulbifer flavimaris]